MADDASWRLFLALWPTPGVRQQVLDHAAGWDWSAGARRTPADRLHMTLHFIGPVPLARVAALADALAVRFEPFEVTLDTAEVWPGGIAVLGAGVVPTPLAGLQGRLGDVLERQALPRETRPFRPHVTLARKAQGSRPADARAAPIRWTAADGYALVQSLPGGQGYRTLRAYGR